MGYSFSQLSIVNLPPTIKSASFFDKLKRLNTFLLLETILVTIAAILAVRVFNASFVSRTAWLVAPGILVAAALIPTAIRRGEFAKMGFNIRQMRHSLVVLGWTCVVVFLALTIGLYLLKSLGLAFPLKPDPPLGQSLFTWLIYQFLYIAVAEEIFFRGYLQSNLLTILERLSINQIKLKQWLSIVISAVIFAVAHIIVQSQIISVLTFLPGLILGWLFIRTRSLLAPILFHGLANAWYCVMTMVFA